MPTYRNEQFLATVRERAIAHRRAFLSATELGNHASAMESIKAAHRCDEIAQQMSRAS
jgi:hypothetical protein